MRLIGNVRCRQADSTDNNLEYGTGEVGDSCDKAPKLKDLPKYMDKAAECVQIWMEEGHTKYQGAAAAGVAYQESGFNIKAKESKVGTGASGVYQYIPKYDHERIVDAGYDGNKKYIDYGFEDQIKIEIRRWKKESETGRDKLYKWFKQSNNVLDALYAFLIHIAHPKSYKGSDKPTKEQAMDAANHAGGNGNVYICYATSIYKNLK